MANLPYFLNANSVCGFFGAHRYLSNFHVHEPIVYDFVSSFYNDPLDQIEACATFKSSENYYQFEKINVIASFENEIQIINNYDSIRERFQECTPAESKKLIKEYRMTKEQIAVWNKVRVPVMFNAVRCKFDIPELQEKLLATGNAYLEESLWWKDKFWGVQYNNIDVPHPKGMKAEDGSLWVKEDGKNILGKILMTVRAEKAILKEAENV